MSKNPVFETMTSLSVEGWSIRVWRGSPSLEEAGESAFVLDDNSDIRLAILSGVRGTSFLPSVGIALSVGALDGVSAVEVLGSTGDGILYYPDWD